MSHSLRRTSPKGKGQPFIGTCMKCGMEGIPLSRMGEECVNPAGLNNEETMILALGLHRKLPTSETGA